MTVKELIEMLSKYNPDQQVTIWDSEWDTTYSVSEASIGGRDGDEVVLS